MIKRQRSDSSLSEASTIILETPEPSSTIHRITRIPDDRSILIHIGTRACYRVSKDILTEVRWFREFFSRNRESSTYHLPDDRFFTIHILFLILHQRLQVLPQFLFLSQLVDLATVCHKYEVTEIVVPHVETRKWVEHAWEDNKTHGDEWVAWIKILRGFYPMEEQCDKLSTVLDVMAANISAVEGHWVFEWNDYRCNVTDIDCPTHAIIDLSLFLERRRDRLWQNLRKACARLHDELLRANREDSLIYRLQQFQDKLQDHIPCSVSMVALLEGLKQHLWVDAIDLQKLLAERRKYLHAGYIDA